MASDFTSNPIVVEAADAAATVRVSRNIFITGVVWDQGDTGANGNNAAITDKNDKRLWGESLITGALKPQPFSPTRPLPAAGLKIPTLDAGILYIYWQETKNG